MLTDKDYEKIYATTFKDCPDFLWEKFLSDMRELSDRYVAEVGTDVIHGMKAMLDGNEQNMLSDIMSAVSVRKLSVLRGIPVSKYKKLINKATLPAASKDISQRLRTLPGGIAASKKNHLNVLHLPVESVRQDYLDGMSMNEISKKYNTYPLKIAKIVSDIRRLSDVELSNATKDVLSQKDAYWYRDKFDSEPKWSLEDLKTFVLEELFENKTSGVDYSNKALIPYFQSIGIVADNDRRNKARSIKSRTEANSAWVVRQTSIELVGKSSFGSVDELTKQYCTNKIGTYNTISSKLNEELETSHFNARQVEKMVTSNPHYFKRYSRGELIFIESVKDALGLTEDDIVRQYRPMSDSQSSVDLYIPSLKIAFEYNGDYWHSDAVTKHNHGVDAATYHQNKVDVCAKSGIKLLFVWESDFEKDSESILKIIESRDFSNPKLSVLVKNNINRAKYIAPMNRVRKILSGSNIPYVKKGNFFECGDLLIRDASKSKNNHDFIKEAQSLGKEALIVYPWHDAEKVRKFIEYKLVSSAEKIFARKCSVEVDISLTREDRRFIEDNHILGYSRFSNIVSVVRLVYKNEVVGMGLFSRVSEDTAELKRLAFCYGRSIPGGASKILSAFFKNHDNFNKVITFSDNDLSEGSVYDKIGFSVIDKSSSNIVFFHPKTFKKFSSKTLYAIGADRLLKNHPNYVHVGISKDAPSNREIVESYGFIPFRDGGYKKWAISRKN